MKLSDSKIQSLIRDGVVFREPETVEIGDLVEIEPGAIIGRGVVIQGESSVSSRTLVSDGAQIFDSHVDSDVFVGMCCKVTATRIGSGSSMDGFAELVATEVSEHCKISAFNNIYRAKVGAGAKVGSHCDLRDVEIGRTSNIAAGVLIANYDGTRKFNTVIGNGVFIGTGVILVAPIDIGDGATIGSGSTITKDVPPDTLAIGRSKQISVEGWSRPAAKSVIESTSVTADRTTSKGSTIDQNLARFRSMVDQQLKEEDYHRFLSENYWIFGAHYEHCHSKERLGKAFIVDLLLERFDGRYDIVELKRPDQSIFVTARNRTVPGRELQHAISQTQDYISYARSHRISEMFDRGIDIRIRQGFIVIGRSKEEEIAALQDLNERHVGVEILTYDDLIKIGQKYALRVERSVDDSSSDPEG